MATFARTYPASFIRQYIEVNYEFKSTSAQYNYIVESHNNGQKKQAVQLFDNLLTIHKKEFLKLLMEGHYAHLEFIKELTSNIIDSLQLKH